MTRNSLGQILGEIDKQLPSGGSYPEFLAYHECSDQKLLLRIKIQRIEVGVFGKKSLLLQVLPHRQESQSVLDLGGERLLSHIREKLERRGFEYFSTVQLLEGFQVLKQRCGADFRNLQVF